MKFNRTIKAKNEDASYEITIKCDTSKFLARFNSQREFDSMFDNIIEAISKNCHFKDIEYKK
jgi:hypothetical protein